MDKHINNKLNTGCADDSDVDYSTPWREDYEQNRSALAASLYTVHPVLRRAVDIWTPHSHTLLSDVASLTRRLPRAATPEDLLGLLRTDIDKAEDALTSG